MQSPTEQISYITYVTKYMLASAPTQIIKKKNQTFKTSEERFQWMFLVITVQLFLMIH